VKKVPKMMGQPNVFVVTIEIWWLMNNEELVRDLWIE